MSLVTTPAAKQSGTVFASSARPVDVVPCPNGDVLLLPALWPVRLTPDQRRNLATELLAYDTPELANVYP